MKKLVFALVALATVSFASCAGEKAQDPEAEANALVDSLKANLDNPEKLVALVGDAQAKIEELTANADTAALNTYKEIINGVINGDVTVKEALQKAASAVGGDVVGNFFNKLTGNAEEAATDAVAEGKEAVEGAADAVEGAAKDAVEDAKATGKEIVDNAKEATKEAVKEKAAEGVEKGLKKLGL